MYTINPKKIATAAPQQDRTIITGKSNRTLSNGSAKRAENDSAISGTNFHLLTSELRSIPLWQLALLVGSAKGDLLPNLLQIIDTEEKQLQCISDLWLIVKAQPEYKGLKDPNFSEGESPQRIIQWLLRKLGPLAKGKGWTVDTYKEGRKIHYRFVVVQGYPECFVRHREVFLPIDFLPMLEKKDKQLHDMIIEVLALVSRKAKIPLWDEDGDFSEALDMLVTGREMYNDELNSEVFGTQSTLRHQRQRELYRDGLPAQYLRKIKVRGKQASRSSFTKLNQGYYNSDMSIRKKQILNWLWDGVKLAEKNDCIANHTFIPGYELDKDIWTPYRNYKIIWSGHSKDVLNTIVTQIYLGEDKTYYPVKFSIVHPDEVLKPIVEPKSNGYMRGKAFPELLDEWMGYGEYMFTRKYCDYFYKNSFAAALTPAEQLLDSIELLETKTQHERQKRKHNA